MRLVLEQGLRQRRVCLRPILRLELLLRVVATVVLFVVMELSALVLALFALAMLLIAPDCNNSIALKILSIYKRKR